MAAKELELEEAELSDRGGHISASEDEEDDDRKHAQLLNAIGALDGKKRPRKAERTEPAPKASEFHVSSGSGKVKLQELVGALKQSGSHTTLKKQLNRVQKHGKTLETPLGKPEQERIQRTVAYESTKKEISKWEPTIIHNRKAEQLCFPLQQPNMSLQTTDQFVKRFQPRTPLEMEVAALLEGSKHVLEKEKLLTAAEEKALRAMSLQEAQERRAELQKYRALLSYKEAKSRRQSKIKSKRFHRILKKEQQKKDKKALDELEKTDPEAYMDAVQRADRQRVQERMSLKHRGGSKFMKEKMVYAKYDKGARQSVQDMLHHSRELTQKTQAVQNSSDESESEGESVEEDKSQDQQRPLLVSGNPWMPAAPGRQSFSTSRETQEAEKIDSPSKLHNKQDTKEADSDENSDLQKDAEGEESEDEVPPSLMPQNIDEIFAAAEKRTKQQKEKEQISKLKKVKPQKGQRNMGKQMKGQKKKYESESDSLSESDSDEETEEISKELTPKGHMEGGLISQSLSRKQTLADLEDEWSDEDGDLKSQQTTKQSKGGKREQTEGSPSSQEGKGKKAEDIQVDPKKILTVANKIRGSQAPALIGDAEDSIDMGEQQRLTIAQAFASDDVIEEFSQEKKSIVDRDKPKDIDLTLPGWGDWGGAGVKPSKRKKRRFIVKAPPGPPRKDRDLSNVIISETKDESVAKYQVSEVPFPFTGVHQFESSIRVPVGKTWNPETSFKQLIKPKVKARMGTVIEPIDKSQMFKKQQTGHKRESQEKHFKGGKKKKMGNKNK